MCDRCRTTKLRFKGAESKEAEQEEQEEEEEEEEESLFIAPYSHREEDGFSQAMNECRSGQ